MKIKGKFLTAAVLLLVSSSFNCVVRAESFDRPTRLQGEVETSVPGKSTAPASTSVSEKSAAPAAAPISETGAAPAEAPISDQSAVPVEAAIFDALGDARLSSQPEKTSGTAKAVQTLTSLGNFVFDLRGFDWSIEGADVALEEKTNYKTVNSREFARRRCFDQKELELVYGIFQTAMSLGIADSDKREQAVTASSTKLTGMLSKSDAEHILDKLQESAAKPTRISMGELWTVDEQREKLRQLVDSAVEHDSAIKALLVRMHKFNHHSKFMRVTAKLVYTTLALASCTPTLAAPAASAGLLTFMSATGGPEQDKLLREMYLYKCLESRYKTIADEAHVILTNAQIAALSDNKPLAACSVELAKHMAGEVCVAKVFPGENLAQLAVTATPHRVPDGL